jgi:hypothetical protein
MKRFAWFTLLVAVAFGAGWLLGASGRSSAEMAARRADERAGFQSARALVLDGRVSLFRTNFGDASRAFEEARGIVERLQISLRETAQPDRAGELEIVLSHLREAQRLAASFDPGAQGAAEAALQALQAVAAPPST